MKLHSEPDYRTPHAVEQYDQERRLRMMFRFLLLTCVVCLVLGLISLLIIDSHAIAYALLILAMLSLPLIWLNHRGFYTLTGLTISVLILSVANFNLITGEGLHDPGVVVYPLIVILGGLFFGTRFLPLYILLTVGSIAAVGWMEASNIIETPYTGILDDVLVISTLTAAGGLIIFEVLKRMERDVLRVRQREYQYRLLADTVTDIIWTADPSLNFTYFSPSIEVLGYSVEDAISLNFEDLLSPESFKIATETLIQELERVEADPRALFESASVELEIIGADGNLIWAEIRTSFIRDENGEITGILGVARDVSARRQAEEERSELLTKIQDQADYTQQIIDTVPEGMVLLGGDQKVVSANRLGREYLGLLSDADVGDPLVQLGRTKLSSLLIPPQDQAWHEVSQGSEFFEIVVEPMVSGDQPFGWVMVIREVTQERESRRIIQRQEKLASLGQLAAGISHDFNNILTVIMLYSNMMMAEASEKSPKTQDRISIIHEQASRGADLILQILDFSRSSFMEMKPFNLKDFMNQQVNLLERTLPESIHIELQTGDDECLVIADSSRLQQVMLNLALNARDAMPDGGELIIELDTAPIEIGDLESLPSSASVDNWARITVKDTGSGMPEEALSHIFEPFYTTKEPGKGTGLGLAQVWGIILQHSGRIEVDSIVGQGTTFRVYLPMMNVGEPGEIIEDDGYLAGAGEVILVVEDESTVREALVETLKVLGYSTLTAVDGKEALTALANQGDRIDLVLSDLVMPELDGKELLREMEDRGLNIPCIILSGHPMTDEVDREGFKALYGWVLKPPDVQKLARTVSSVLHRDSVTEGEDE
ncbi:MAG: PAS domain S-box protein [Chloroflexota bacterium]|nr:PAS domain S-box protein [Chloroflexota bacterium]